MGGIARFIKKIIHTIPFLADMKAIKGQLDTQNLFDVGGAIANIFPSVKSVGITGQITGTRADVLISDDCEVPKNSATQLQREKLSEAVKEFIMPYKSAVISLEFGLYSTLRQEQDVHEDTDTNIQ